MPSANSLLSFFGSATPTAPAAEETPPITPPADTSAAAGAEGGSENNTDNDQNNLAALAKIWEDPNAGSDNAQATVPPSSGSQNQNQQPSGGGDDTVTNYIKSLNFLPEGGVNTQQLAEQLQQNDTSGLTELIHDTSKRAFVQAITTMDNLVQPRIAQAVNDAVLQSRETAHGDLNQLTMFRELPFTAQAAIQPVASEILQRALKSGKSTPEAIALVKNFFSQTAKGMGFVDPAEFGGPGSGPIRPGPAAQNGGGRRRPATEDVDWIKTLTAADVQQ